MIIGIGIPVAIFMILIGVEDIQISNLKKNMEKLT